MLTKNLIKSRTVDGVLKPTFIQKNNQAAKGVARLISVTALANQGKSFEAFKAAVECDEYVLSPVAAGLTKVLKDEFIEHEAIDFSEYRRGVFAASEVNRVGASSFDEFEELMTESMGETPNQVRTMLYGDLDDQTPMVIEPSLNAEKLIDAYNISMLKGLIFHARRVKVSISAVSTEIKSFVRKVNFLGLYISSLEMEDGNLTMEISGPLTFKNAAKAYGLKFVGVVKTLLEYEDWFIEADVEMQQKKGTLKLGSGDLRKVGLGVGVKSSDYVSEDVTSLIDALNSSNSSWKFSPAKEIVNLGRKVYSFPVIKAQAQDGKTKFFELLSPWQTGDLHDKLELLNERKSRDIIVGFDKKAKLSSKTEKMIENLQGDDSFIFTFRDVPTLRKINNFLA